MQQELGWLLPLGTHFEVRLQLWLRLHLYLQLCPAPLLLRHLLRLRAPSLALLLVMLISFRRWRLPTTPDGSNGDGDGYGDGDAANDVFNWFSCCTSPAARCKPIPIHPNRRLSLPGSRAGRQAATAASWILSLSLFLSLCWGHLAMLQLATGNCLLRFATTTTTGFFLCHFGTGN